MSLIMKTLVHQGNSEIITLNDGLRKYFEMTKGKSKYVTKYK